MLFFNHTLFQKKINVKISQKLLEKLMECIDDLDLGNELIEIDEENENEEETKEEYKHIRHASKSF